MLSIYVDVGCRKNPGPFEIKGMIAVPPATLRGKETYEQIFLMDFPLGSNNIGEYLAICFGCIYGEDSGEEYEVWSDSMTAISWVKKSMNTTVSMDEKTAELVDLAHSFFSEDTDRIQRVKFWNTKEKGDIPADFGRKFKSKKK